MVFEVITNKTIPEIKIDGYIGKWDSVNYSGIKKEIKALVGKHKEVKLVINSGGGSVLEGFAIYDLLTTANIKITAHVEGMAASMASIILLAAKPKDITMTKHSRVMIHRVSGGVWGNADDMRSAADDIDEMEEQMKDIYQERTGQSREIVDDWMSGTDKWFTSKKAVKAGLIGKNNIIKTIENNDQNYIDAIVTDIENSFGKENDLSKEDEKKLNKSYIEFANCFKVEGENKGNETSEEVINKKIGKLENTVMKIKDLLAKLINGDKDATIEEVNKQLEDQNLQVVSTEEMEALEKEIEKIKGEQKTDSELKGELEIANKAIEEHAKVVEAHETAVKEHEEVAAKLVVADASVETLTAEVGTKTTELETANTENKDLKTRNVELAKNIQGKPKGDQNTGEDVEVEPLDYKELKGMSDTDQSNAYILKAQEVARTGVLNPAKK